MTVTIDQPHLQQCVPWSSGQGDAGLLDDLAPGSGFEGQWSSSATKARQAEVWDLSSLGKNRPTANKIAASHRLTPLDHHLEKAHATLAELIRRERHFERDNEHRQALQWLGKHRQCYAGQWIALKGSELLAVEKTAREVYDRVRERHPHALIVKVEKEELPFAGW